MAPHKPQLKITQPPTLARTMFSQLDSDGWVTTTLNDAPGVLSPGDVVIAYEVDEPNIYALASVESLDRETGIARLQVDTSTYTYGLEMAHPDDTARLIADTQHYLDTSTTGTTVAA